MVQLRRYPPLIPTIPTAIPILHKALKLLIVRKIIRTPLLENHSQSHNKIIFTLPRQNIFIFSIASRVQIFGAIGQIVYNAYTADACYWALFWVVYAVPAAVVLGRCALEREVFGGLELFCAECYGLEVPVC